MYLAPTVSFLHATRQRLVIHSKTSNKTCSKPFNYKNLLPIPSSDNHSKTVMQGPHSITTAMQALNTSLVLGGGVSLPPSPDQPDQPVPSALMSYPSVLTLDVGGRIFKVSRKKLEAGSSHFRSLLSNTTAWEPQEDGTYFLDADADLFEHMLRFMRRPEVFPLFYDASKGFDYDLYNRLEVEATHFQVWELAKWIAEKVSLIGLLTSCCSDSAWLFRCANAILDRSISRPSK